MNVLIENWYVWVALAAALFVVGAGGYAFFRRPTDKQLVQIREWLLWAVTKAEAELGDGTGQLKLRFVYDLFLTRFGWLARVLPFAAFSALVDDALEQMRHLLETNPQARALVKGDGAE